MKYSYQREGKAQSDLAVLKVLEDILRVLTRGEEAYKSYLRFLNLLENFTVCNAADFVSFQVSTSN